MSNKFGDCAKAADDGEPLLCFWHWLLDYKGEDLRRRGWTTLPFYLIQDEYCAADAADEPEWALNILRWIHEDFMVPLGLTAEERFWVD